MSGNQTKTAVITGASSGFGRATAIKLAAQGWKIIALARRMDKILELQAELGMSNCEPIEFDVREDQHVQSLVEYLQTSHQSIELLVNNAGLALGLDSADKANIEDWQTMIDTNITGLVKVTRALLPEMVKSNRGHIINIGSIAGTYPYPGGNAYGATKAFVAQFSLNLRADLAGTNIRVTNIEPGLAESEFSLVRFHGNKTKADSVYEGVEALSSEDVAECVVWSASMPAHVNINRLEVMPTCQAFAPLTISR